MANAVQIVIKALDSTRGGFQSALKNVQGFRASASAMGAVAVTAAAAVGAAYVGMAKAFAETADEMGKLSEKTGIATETLSRLKFVAEESSISWDTMQKALRSASEEASRSGQSFEELLSSNADRFSQFADGAGKAAEAQRIFGKAGADLIPLLNKGSAGMQQAMQDAEKFTTIIDAQTAATADEFGTTLKRVGDVIRKSWTDSMKDALPYMLEFSRHILELVKTVTGSDQQVSSFGGLIKEIAKGMAYLSLGALNAAQSVKTFAGMIAGAFSDPSGKTSIEAYNKLMAQLVQQGEKVENLWNGKIDLPEPKDKPPPQFMPDLKDLEKSLDLATKMREMEARGSASVLAQIGGEHAQRLKMIEELAIAEEDKRKLSEQSRKLRETQEAEAIKQMVTLKADLEDAYRNGDLAKTMQHLESKKALQLADLENNQALIDVYVEQWRLAHQNIQGFMATVASSFSQNFGSALGEVLRDVGSAGEAFRNLGKAMIQTVTNFIGQWIAARVTMLALSAVFGVAAAKSVAPAAALLGKIWAGPAALASVATLGSAGAAGIAGLTAASTAAMAIGTLGGIAHGGMDYVPAEQTYLLNKGERVIQPSQNEKLTEFLDGAGGGSSIVEIFLDGEVLARGIGRMAADGRMTISAKAIV